MQALFGLIAVLTIPCGASVGPIREKRQIILSSDDLNVDSSFLCRNGGTSFAFEGEHLWCVCPDGYTGLYCEKASTQAPAHCYTGIGLNYMGRESRSRSGRQCLPWSRSDGRLGDDIWLTPLENHNYCRNKDYSRKPWCYVNTMFGVIKEYCNIPPCVMLPTLPTAKPQPSKPVTAWPDIPQPSQPDPDPTCGERRTKLMKIVGGAITPVESQPWMAAIYWRGSSRRKAFLCGGSLIAPCWVLTAAHCFQDGQNTMAGKISVILGKSAINETDTMSEQKFDVEEVIIHEDFDNSQGSFNNDIALLKIKSRRGRCARETKTVKTVCLPLANQPLPTGHVCEIAGYGKEKDGLWYYSQYLREAKVELISQNTCSSKTYYGSMITDNMFCAGSPNWATDACKGDSGGPLVCEVSGRMVLFGVISWGDGCAKAFRPGVYTRVSNYASWIAKHTGQANTKADVNVMSE